MLQVLNELIRQYLGLPPGTMFMRPLKLEIVRTSRKHFRALNDLMRLVPNVELMCFNEEQLLVVKLHCEVPIDGVGELLQLKHRIIVVHGDGSTSSNCLHLSQRKQAIRAVLLPATKQDDCEALDGYLSMMEIFCQHLNISVLAHSREDAESIHPLVCMFDRLE